MTKHNRQLFRMAQWFFFSIILYAVVLIKPEGWPLIITAALLKGANVNAGAFMGYWVDRTLFSVYDREFAVRSGEFEPPVKAARVIARGIIVAAAIWGFSNGISA